MADPCAPYPYQERYEEAVRLFDKGDFEASIKLAENNVAVEKDQTLPPYYLIKNAILIASGMDDWADADVWRLTAEQAYITCLDEARKQHNDNSPNILDGLRDELDQLSEFRANDLDAFNALMASDEEEENEDADADADAGVEDEIIDLPIRPPSEQTKSVPAVKVDAPTNDSSATSSAPKEIRQKTAEIRKGGAYHFHSFTESLNKGSGSGSARASILGMDWEANNNAQGQDSRPSQ